MAVYSTISLRGSRTREWLPGISIDTEYKKIVSGNDTKYYRREFVSGRASEEINIFILEISLKI